MKIITYYIPVYMYVSPSCSEMEHSHGSSESVL